MPVLQEQKPAIAARHLVVHLVGRIGLAAFTPLGGRHQHTMFTGGRKHAMKAGEIDAWLWYQCGEGEQIFSTNPLLTDSDGDRLNDGLEAANNANPLDAADWPALADGDLAPLYAPDGLLNAGDLHLARRIALGLKSATPLELAHGDLYPPGTPDGTINLQDLILLRQMMQ